MVLETVVRLEMVPAVPEGASSPEEVAVLMVICSGMLTPTQVFTEL